MTNGFVEKHSDDVWRKTARELLRQGGAAAGMTSHDETPAPLTGHHTGVTVGAGSTTKDLAAHGISATARTVTDPKTGQKRVIAPYEDPANPGKNRNGEPLLGDSRDAFRPATGDIPTDPGVYKWRDGAGRVIYVGKAKNLRQRLTYYFQPLSQLQPKTQAMVLTGRSLEWTVVGTEMEALTLEYTWIKEFDPRFNVVFRDDKTYPYLAVSFGEEIPRIWITRSQRMQKTRYFGPYTRAYDLRRSLDSLLKTFPVRTCTPNRFARARKEGRPCLLYSIGKCSAPCVGAISPAEHRDMMKKLTAVLTGRVGERYISGLRRQMGEAAEQLDFEKAARLRDQITAMNGVIQENGVVFSDNVDADVFGYAGDELEASVHAFFVRSGTIRGERNWSVEKVEDVSDAALMSDMISQVYSQIEDDSRREGKVDEQAARQEQAETPTERTSETSGAQADGTPGTSDMPLARSSQTGTVEGTPARSTRSALDISTQRDAVSVAEDLGATTQESRAASTRRRHEREAVTGRVDLFSDSAPVPPEIIVPVLPDDRARLEAWLTGLRGSKVTIRTAQRGDKKNLMDRADKNARLALAQSKARRTSSLAARQEAMNDIKEQLGLPEAPLRIEGYDVSNAAGGGYQVASMVVFEDGMARRSEYRRFSIKGGTGRDTSLDDLSALYQTMTRRFRHGNIAGDSGDSIEAERRIERAEDAATGGRDGQGQKKVVTIVSGSQGADRTDEIIQQDTNTHHFAYKPNLIVVDGGAGQVKAVEKALDDCGVHDVAVCGLAKRLEEVWLPGEDYPLILDRQSQGMYLLQRVRDESHRFAITYHRTRRRRGQISSALDAVPGVGPAYARRLRAHFGSMKKIRGAGVDQIEQVKGIGPKKARQIYDALHPPAGGEAK